MVNPNRIRPRFGVIHMPRTRTEKLDHQRYLNLCPIEMVLALKEREEIRSGSMNKRNDPISNIIMKFDHSPENDLVEALCRACAMPKVGKDVWENLFHRVTELLSGLSPTDCGIILKCLILASREKSDLVPSDSELIQNLLAMIYKGCCSGFQIGDYTILYGIQALNHFANRLEEKANRRYFNKFIGKIKLRSIGFPLLVSIMHSISQRCPLPNLAIIAPILAELRRRVSSANTIDDIDMLSALVTSASKFHSSDETREILRASQRFLIDPGLGELVTACSIEQLTGLVHAYSRMGPVAASGYVDLFRRLGNELSACEPHLWTPRILAVVLNGFSTASVLHNDLLDTLDMVIPILAGKCDPTQTSMIIYSLSKLGIIKRFDCMIERVHRQVDEFNLHSQSKLIVAVPWTDKILYEKFMMKVESHPGPWSNDELNSVILVLNHLYSAGSDQDLSLLSSLVSSNVDKLTWSQLVSYTRMISSLRMYASEELHRNVIMRLRLEDESLLSLPDLIVVLHGIINGHQVTPVSDVSFITDLLRRKVSGIRELTFRPLNRLASLVARVGIVDEDLREVVEDALDAYKRNS
jgi:hypothetical protein